MADCRLLVFLLVVCVSLMQVKSLPELTEFERNLILEKLGLYQRSLKAEVVRPSRRVQDESELPESVLAELLKPAKRGQLERELQQTVEAELLRPGKRGQFERELEHTVEAELLRPGKRGQLEEELEDALETELIRSIKSQSEIEVYDRPVYNIPCHNDEDCLIYKEDQGLRCNTTIDTTKKSQPTCICKENYLSISATVYNRRCAPADEICTAGYKLDLNEKACVREELEQREVFDELLRPARRGQYDRELEQTIKAKLIRPAKHLESERNVEDALKAELLRPAKRIHTQREQEDPLDGLFKNLIIQHLNSELEKEDEVEEDEVEPDLPDYTKLLIEPLKKLECGREEPCPSNSLRCGKDNYCVCQDGYFAKKAYGYFYRCRPVEMLCEFGYTFDDDLEIFRCKIEEEADDDDQSDENDDDSNDNDDESDNEKEDDDNDNEESTEDSIEDQEEGDSDDLKDNATENNAQETPVNTADETPANTVDQAPANSDDEEPGTANEAPASNAADTQEAPANEETAKTLSDSEKNAESLRNLIDNAVNKQLRKILSGNN